MAASAPPFSNPPYSDPPPSNPPHLDSRRAWVMAFSSSLMLGAAFGTMLCITVFLKPLEAEFGWERGVTSFAYSISAFFVGSFGIGMGRLVDRISVRPILLFGAVMMGISQMLLSRIDSLWQLYLIYGLLVGALANGSFLVPLMTNIGFWFERNKGLAVGVVMAGQSLGGALMPALARWLIASLGWREAYLVLGAVSMTVLIVLALIVRDPPGIAATKASAKIAGPSRAVIAPAPLSATLCVAIVCCCICMSIPLIHIYPLALEQGLLPTAAAAVLSVIMVTSIVGRVGIGRLADRIGGVRSLLLASALQTAMVFWFSQISTLPWFFAVGILYGIGYGGVIPSYAIIVREMIPTHRVGVVMGMVFFFGNLGMALGGYLGGVIYDLSGGYTASYATGALAGVANLVIVGGLLVVIRMRRPPIPAPAG